MAKRIKRCFVRRLVISFVALPVAFAFGRCGDINTGRGTAGDSGLRRYELVYDGSSAEDVLFSVARSLRIAVDSKGQIYVADVDHISILSETGSLLRTVGRPGDGPGEFRFIWNIQTLPTDSILVYDLSLRRITVLKPYSGEVAYTLSVDGTYPLYWVEKIPGSSLYLAASQRPFRSADSSADDAQRMGVLHLLDSTGDVRRDSLLVFPIEEFLVARSSAAVAVAPDPFGRRSIFRLRPDGRIQYGWTDSAGITTYDLDGRKVGSFVLHHEPALVSEKDIERALATRRRMFHEVLRKTAPSHWPIFKNMIVDDRGWTWVAFIAANGDVTTWALFDDSGGPRGSAIIPEVGVDLKVVKEGRAYGVVTNEFDVPRVVFYRIEGR